MFFRRRKCEDVWFILPQALKGRGTLRKNRLSSDLTLLRLLLGYV